MDFIIYFYEMIFVNYKRLWPMHPPPTGGLKLRENNQILKTVSLLRITC